MRLEVGRDLIQPFAGVYPTRWKIEASYSYERGARRPNREFKYIGKPDQLVAWHVRHILRRSLVGRVEAREFDRGGVIAYALQRTQREHLNISDWSPIFRFYYPFAHANAIMLTPWTQVFQRIPVIHRGKRAMIYSAYLSDIIQETQWQEHKTWLEGANLRLA